MNPDREKPLAIDPNQVSAQPVLSQEEDRAPRISIRSLVSRHSLARSSAVTLPRDHANGSFRNRWTAALQLTKPSDWLNIEYRKTDLLWVAISIALAAFTWRYAIRDAYAPIWLYIALHIQCAFIFAIRKPARLSSRRPVELVVILLSLNYFFAFDPVPISAATFTRLGNSVSAIGAVLALISVQCLGRSFAVLPSVRTIRTTGAYRIVRHPIYLSYIVMALGILVRHPSLYNGAVALLGVVLMVWRMSFEERLLAADQTYCDYMKRVPYRLIPGLY